jgi:neurofibromin 1
MVSTESTTTSGTASPAPSRDSRNAGPSTGMWSRSPSSSSYTLGTRFLQHHSYPSSGSYYSPAKSKLLSSTCNNNTTTATQMTKLLSRITFYLTASNWSQTFARIKTRIQHLTTTIEDNPELIEMRFLEWANVNRQRLSQILSEVSMSFLHIKRPSQTAVATTLRQAIWNWINAYPQEYEVLIESNRKFEGGPDVLFDVLASMSDLSSSSNARRTRAFYPLMGMCLVLASDVLKKVVLGDLGPRGTGGLSKKVYYLESLRKGLQNSKGFEACVSSYVDLMSAGVAVSGKLESSGVRSLILDIQSDLRVSPKHD